MLVKKKSKKRKQSDANYYYQRKNIREKLFNIIGNDCFICHSKKQLKCHNKAGEKHKLFDSLSISGLAKINPNEYVRLCFKCHYAVHWLYNNFKFAWDDVLKLRDGE